MVKVLFLSLLVAMMCGLASTLPAPQLARSFRQELFVSPPPSTSPVLEDPATRNERSTNLSYITGTARKIQLFIKNRHLQLLPDGTVNGTDDASSIYTILQRISVGVGEMKIQGLSTCQYLCMDCNGLLFGSRESLDDCVFKEKIEHNHYNTYYSMKYSNDKRTFYLALNGKGQPKKVVLRANKQLGHLSSYTRVLTRAAPSDWADHTHPVRHHAHMCSETYPNRDEQQHLATNRPTRCPKKKKKRKKKKKKCETCNKNNNNNKNQSGDEEVPVAPSNAKRHNKNKVNKVKKCENKNSDECPRAGVNNNNNNNRKRQKKLGGDNRQQIFKKKKKNQKIGKNNNNNNKKTRVFTTEIPSTVVPLTTEEAFHDEDYYTVDNSTHWDWDSESSTAHPEESTSTSTTVTHPD